MIQRKVCLDIEHDVLPDLDLAVVGADVDDPVLGPVAAVGRGLGLGAHRGLAVLVVGGQVDLLRVLGNIEGEPGQCQR